MTEKISANSKTCGKALSRREFLKYSGTVVLMVEGACYLPGCIGDADASSTASGNIPASDGYILVDMEKCQGCASCMLACSLVHEGVQSQSLSRIQIMQSSFEGFPNDLVISQCRQCVEPACVQVCPEDALTADPGFGNTRIVDRSKCVGCGECTAACPFTPSRSVLVPDEKYDYEDKANKCDLCANTPFHWDEGGGGPKGKQACVEICPLGAIAFAKETPKQSDSGYNVDLKGWVWPRLGYPKI